MDLGIELKCSFELNLFIKLSFALLSDLIGGWKVYGVQLIQFVYDFNEFS